LKWSSYFSGLGAPHDEGFGAPHAEGLGAPHAEGFGAPHAEGFGVPHDEADAAMLLQPAMLDRAIFAFLLLRDYGTRPYRHYKSGAAGAKGGTKR